VRGVRGRGTAAVAPDRQGTTIIRGRKGSIKCLYGGFRRRGSAALSVEQKYCLNLIGGFVLCAVFLPISKNKKEKDE
jgi:hypothetical protein